MNTLPGFTADASLYATRRQYRAAASRGLAGTAVVPQMAVGVGLGMSSDSLYLCQLFCLYCRYTGYFCWPCYICAWSPELDW